MAVGEKNRPWPMSGYCCMDLHERCPPHFVAKGWCICPCHTTRKKAVLTPTNSLAKIGSNGTHD